MRHNNTKIHGPMGVTKEIALHAGDEVVIFCMKFQKKSCPFKLSPSSFKDLEMCLLLCILLIFKTTLSYPQIHNDTLDTCVLISFIQVPS